MEGGDRRRGVALFALAAERAHGLELVLAEQAGELRKRGHAAVAGETGRDGQRQHGLQGIALAPRLAALGHLAQALEQAAQPRRGHRLGAGLAVPVCRRLVSAQRRGGAFGQFVHEELLGLAVMAPARRAAGLAGKAAGRTQRAPVRRAVAGLSGAAGKARGVDERLRQQHRIAMRRPHVPRHAPQAQRQHPRRQVRHPARRQDDEARVVGDQMQAPELLLRAPADPAVARGQLERARLPADEREPARSQRRDMAQTLAEHAMKRQVVMGRHQLVPAPVFLRAPGRTHRDRAQINGAIPCQQRSHGRHNVTSKTKWPAPESAEAASRPAQRTKNGPGLTGHLAWNCLWPGGVYSGTLLRPHSCGPIVGSLCLWRNAHSPC